MGWSIILDDTVTLDAFTFEPEFVATPTDNGRIDKTEVFINATGVITRSTAALVAARAIELSETITEQVSPIHVEIKLDGVTQWDFPVSESINSPIITRFRLKSEADGSGESYWPWELSIYAVGSGRGDGTVGLQTSLLIEKVNGEIVRKTWKAEAQASSAESAESKVRSFQPADDKIKEGVEKFYQEGRATGIWIWEARKAGAIIDISETITITGMGDGYEFDPQINEAGNADPIIHRKPRGGVTTIIRGTIRALDVDIAIPGAHFSESDSMVRDFAAEENWPEAIPDGEEGIKQGVFRRDYMEVWKSTGDPGAADHADHAEVNLLEPPSDGNIAGGA